MVLETQEITAWVKGEIDLNMLKVLAYHQTVFSVGHPSIYNYEKSVLWTPKINASFYEMLIFKLKTQIPFS